MRILLQEIIGPDCVSLDQGERVYRLLWEELKERRTVEVDFQGVETLFSPFLMGSWGKLLGHFEKEFIMQKITLCHISPEQLKSVNDFIDRAEAQLIEQGDLQTMKELFEEDELGDL